MTTLFSYAKDSFSCLGVDVEQALKTLASTPISLHCWQGDDVRGFEVAGEDLGGGLAVTGNYPGRARTITELRADLEMALKLIPGKHRLNLHAIYGDFEGRAPERDAIGFEHFSSWVDWAIEQGMGMDFNPTCFGHPKAEDGLTLSHPDRSVRAFWIEHCKRSREIAAEIGKQVGSACVNNIWIPDGMKDVPVDRLGFRTRLEASLDEMFSEDFKTDQLLDAVESKLFGIGSESFVVGSHEFYLGYAAKHQKTLCLDAGHFHPTESVAEKISSASLFVPHLLLHVSRGVRWDSDHVVILDDPTRAIFEELVRGDLLNRTHIGLDFFDASINRIAAWTIGSRSAQKALLIALLQPIEQLRKAEMEGDYTQRLALLEECRSLPWGAVWQEFCRRENTPEDHAWMTQVRAYEQSVLAKRS